MASIEVRFSRAVIVIALLGVIGGSNKTAALSDADFVPEVIASQTIESPLLFIENVGQWDAQARFQVLGEHVTWLAEDALWFTAVEQSRDAGADVRPQFMGHPGATDARIPRDAVNIKLTFVGANPHARIVPFNRSSIRIGYFRGSNSTLWTPEVPVWEGVRYVDLYPGVDLELRSEQGQVVQRLSARNGADTSAVSMRMEGAQLVGLDESDLLVATVMGEIRLRLPDSSFGFQVEALSQTGKTVVVTSPAQSPDSESDGASVPNQSSDNPGMLLYGTYLGGNQEDHGLTVAVDAAGGAYLAGITYSPDFPSTTGAFDPNHAWTFDAFIAKYPDTGPGPTYITIVGGNSHDIARKIAVDAEGSVYLAGDTYSDDFPTTTGAFDRSLDGGHDGFVVKLQPSGSGLTYSTYLGGSAEDFAGGIALDSAGSAYVVGGTGSSNFPTTPGAFDRSLSADGSCFVAKLNQMGSGLTYATLIDSSICSAVAVSSTGNAFVTGDAGPGFPATQGAFDRTHNGSYDAFVAKLSSTGSQLAYATYLGGGNQDSAVAIVLDETDNAYLAGVTSSGDFPTTQGAIDRTFNNDTWFYDDAFVAKINATGSSLLYSTFLGGDAAEEAYDLAVSAGDRVLVTGATASSDFPVTGDAFDQSYNGGFDAFLVELSLGDPVPAYATLLGTSGDDLGLAVTVDGTGRIYLVGDTNSIGFPTQGDSADRSYNGGPSDAFLVRMATTSTSFSITGRVLDGHGHALSRVFVGLLAEGVSSYITSTYALSDGSYVFTISPDATRYQVRVIMRDKEGRTEIGWDDILSVAVTTPWFSREEAGTRPHDLDFADPALDGGGIPNSELDDMAALYFHARQVQDFVRDELNVDIPAVSYIRGKSPLVSSNSASYDPVSEGINIGSLLSEYWWWQRPMNREWHESFHHLMNNIRPAGLDTCLNCPNHGGIDNPDTSDSWVEGWAEFWPCVLEDHLGGSKPYLYRMDIPISMEVNYRVWDRTIYGASREEFAVASLLWDLYDPIAKADSDNIDLSLDDLWALLGKPTNDNPLYSMHDVYRKLMDANLTNEDGTKVSIFDVMEVFVSHGFWDDANTDRLWQTDEEVGWGGSITRPSYELIPNAYLKATIQDVRGQILSEGKLTVSLQYENSYYDHTSPVTLAAEAEGLLYMELPPSRIPVTVTLQVQSGGAISEPFSINNAEFWPMVANATDGYALEHTFTVYPMIYLPLVQRR